MTITQSVLDATKGAEGVVVATEWPEFKNVDWAAVYNQMSKPAFIFDGRLLLDARELREIGFRVGYRPVQVVNRYLTPFRSSLLDEARSKTRQFVL